MKKKNVILISFDEVRPDHLSCYGYKKKTTPNIDKVAENGVLFETCIAAGCFTPICMSSVITGCYPNKHTVRDPYCTLQRTSIAGILKDYGYTTAGFSGNGVLGSAHGFGQGFESYDEPTEQEGHHFDTWQPDSGRELFYGGNWWVDRFFEWLEKNHNSEPFFVWGHLYHTHRGGERPLLEKGLLSEKDDNWMFYYDPKLKICDELVMGELLRRLDEYGISDRTVLVFCSDHGTNLGERETKGAVYLRPDQPAMPCHLNLYDINVKVACIFKDNDLPKGVRIPGQVRSVDIIPTILDSLDIPVDEYDMDGTTLLPDIKKGRAEGRLAYSENLQEWETEENALRQSLRTEDFHFIRNLHSGTEEWYNVKKDPGERENIIDQVRESRKKEVLDLRKIMNDKILKSASSNKEWSDEEKAQIKERLRRLGYAS
jgi:arylsulfatase A-like enzyme